MAVLVVLGVLVEPGLVPLLPAPMRAGCANPKGRSREGQGQERRWRRGGTFRLQRSSFSLLLGRVSSLSQAQGQQGGAGGSPRQPVGGVTLEGELQLALLGGNEPPGAGEVNRDDGRVLACGRGERGERSEVRGYLVTRDT